MIENVVKKSILWKKRLTNQFHINFEEINRKKLNLMSNLCVISNLNMFQYQWTNEFIVESLEFVSNMVVSGFANNIFHASHQMINQLK